MSTILAIAGADAAERTRRFAFLLTIIAALYGGYLYAPEASAGYVTVAIDNYRGIYNSAWMGSMSALLCAAFISLIGFYLVRGAIERDRELDVDGVVAASPVRKLTFLLGKFASNVLVLAAVAGVTFLAACLMQMLRGESFKFNAFDYLVPFAIVALPGMAFVAALAVFMDSIALLRGIIGNILYIFIWTSMVILPLNMTHEMATVTVLDPLGTSVVMSQMQAALHVAAPRANLHDMVIGGDQVRNGSLRTFAFGGMKWTADLVLGRLLWFAVSVALVFCAAPFFDRFRRESAARTKRSGLLNVARLIPNVSGLRLYRAELALLINGASIWWLLGAIALAVLTGALPTDSSLKFLVPLAFIWPLERWSVLGSRERRWNVDDILAATPRPITRSIFAQWAAGGSLGILLCAGFIIKLVATGHPLGALACIAAAGAFVAIALACGVVTGSSRLFEGAYLIVWYIGPMNHMAALDFVGATMSAPMTLLAVAIALTAASITTAFFGRMALRLR